MGHELFRTKIRRAAKLRKSGRRTRRALENKGSTDSFPLTGPLPAMRYGKIVKDDKIIVPVIIAPKKVVAAKTARAK